MSGQNTKIDTDEPSQGKVNSTFPFLLHFLFWHKFPSNYVFYWFKTFSITITERNLSLSVKNYDNKIALKIFKASQVWLVNRLWIFLSVFIFPFFLVLQKYQFSPFFLTPLRLIHMFLDQSRFSSCFSRENVTNFPFSSS